MSAAQDALLAVETAYFDAHAEELLLAHPNRFLPIYGEELVGNFVSRSEAVAEGVRRFGCGPFLVRRTGDKTLEPTAPALAPGSLQCRP